MSGFTITFRGVVALMLIPVVVAGCSNERTRLAPPPPCAVGGTDAPPDGQWLSSDLSDSIGIRWVTTRSGNHFSGTGWIYRGMAWTSSHVVGTIDEQTCSVTLTLPFSDSAFRAYPFIGFSTTEGRMFGTIAGQEVRLDAVTLTSHLNICHWWGRPDPVCIDRDTVTTMAGRYSSWGGLRYGGLFGYHAHRAETHDGDVTGYPRKGWDLPLVRRTRNPAIVGINPATRRWEFLAPGEAWLVWRSWPEMGADSILVRVLPEIP